jgi:UDP:flavonoid glycosyltransferase YjiC (YdhE family)
MWTCVFRRVSRQLGGPPFNRALELFEGDYNLVTDIPELPPNWTYVGPIFAHLDGEVPPEVRGAAARHPSVYCAMGSSANRDLLKIVLESFAGTPYSVIAPVQAHTRVDGRDRHPL